MKKMRSKIMYTAIAAMFFIAACTASSKSKSSEKVDNIVVNFTSKGSGINYKVKNNIDQLLQDKYSEIQIVKTSYGREGEIEYCVNLVDLKAKNVSRFTNDIKETIGDAPTVKYFENRQCREKKN